jgi:phosphatidate phosphatase
MIQVVGLNMIFGSILNVLFISLTAALPLLIFKVSVTPYTRGFYCNDESIKYPFKSSTVTSAALYSIGFVVNIILVRQILKNLLYSQTPRGRGGIYYGIVLRFPL